MCLARRWPIVKSALQDRTVADTTGDHVMKRFVVERYMPGACDLTAAELAEITKKANIAAASLGVPYRWVTSYVAASTRVDAAFRQPLSPWSSTRSTLRMRK